MKRKHIFALAAVHYLSTVHRFFGRAPTKELKDLGNPSSTLLALVVGLLCSSQSFQMQAESKGSTPFKRLGDALKAILALLHTKELKMEIDVHFTI